MPVTALPDLSENPGAVFGTGDLAICNPVELENGAVALLAFEVPPEARTPGRPFETSLADHKAALALVFTSLEAVDQLAAALAEARNTLLAAGEPCTVPCPEPVGEIGRHLSVKRLRRELHELIAEAAVFDPKHGNILMTADIRRYLDNLHRGRR